MNKPYFRNTKWSRFENTDVNHLDSVLSENKHMIFFLN
jgi:hypothetical protein